MGFGINSKGTDLFDRLSSKEEFQDKLYGLYVIGLATKVDDESIKWFWNFGSPMDSLTGDNVAFFLFYNSLKFEGSTNYPSKYAEKDFVDYTGTKKIFHTMKDNNMRLEEYERIRAKRYKPDYLIPDNFFVTSMTYQSDEIVKKLELDYSILPCLLFIDPISKEIQPLRMRDLDNLFSKLRDIMTQFYSKQNRPHLSLINQFNEKKDFIPVLESNKNIMREEIEKTDKKFSKEKLTIEDLISEENYRIAKNKLNSWLKLIFNNNIPEKYLENIDQNFTEDVFLYDKRIKRIKRMNEKTLSSLFTDGFDDYRKKKILREFFHKTLRYLLQDEDKEISNLSELKMNDWTSLINTSLRPNSQHESKIKLIKETLYSIDLNELKDKTIVSIEREILEIDKNIRFQEKQLDELKDKIKNSERVEIIPLIKKLDSEKNSPSFIHNPNLQKGLEHTSKGLNIVDKILRILN